MFAMTRFRNIRDLLHVLLITIAGLKNIVRSTEDFVRVSLNRGSTVFETKHLVCMLLQIAPGLN